MTQNSIARPKRTGRQTLGSGWAVLVCATLSACGGDSFAPADGIHAGQPATAIGSSAPGCATVSVTINSSNQANAVFPSSAVCSTGFVLTAGGVPSYVKSSRRLTIPVRVTNYGPDIGQPPINVVLQKDSATVTSPSSVQGSITSFNPDSVGQTGAPNAGVAYWLLGSSALAIGQSTMARSLVFTLPNKTTGVRLGLRVDATLPDTGAPVVPGDWTEQLAPEVVVTDPLNPKFEYFRHRFIVGFREAASGLSVQAVLQRYGATVVGGVPTFRPRGAYVLAVADRGAGWSLLYDSLTAEPDIATVSAVDKGKPLEGRGIPDDGPGLTRSDWLSHSASVQPWLAVRAPQAWRCETGTYTTARIKVGVIDNHFHTQHHDFASSQVRIVPPRSPRPNGFAGYPANYREHGTKITSVFVARGDDSIGTAGMLWGANVSLYPMAVGTSYTQSAVWSTYHDIYDAATAGVRVLLLSAGVGNAARTGEVDLLADAIETYLASGGYLVIASGSNGIALPISVMATSQDSTLFATDVAAGRLYQAYQNQIYFVPGATRNHSFLPSSHYWSGATNIAAPGELVRVRTEDAPNFADGSGSSYAAPFVAGLVGQLLSIDPNLSPSEVAHYIVDGAKEPRRDPSSGALSIPQPLSGVPLGGTLYQMDAFGSLSLLAKERSTAPVCGYTVSSPLTWPNNVILLNKGPNAGDTVRVTIAGLDPFNGGVAPMSVSAGGREIAVRVSGDATIGTGTLIVNAQGVRLYAAPPTTYWRQYIDRGHVDYRYTATQVNGVSGQQLNVTITGYDGALSRPTFQLRDETGAIALWPLFSGGWDQSKVAVSPRGEYIGFVHRHWIDPGPTPTRIAYYAQRVGSTSAQLIQSFPSPCTVGQADCIFEGNFGGLWAPDGGRVFFGHRHYEAGTTSGPINEYKVGYQPAGSWTFAPEGSAVDQSQVFDFPLLDPDGAALRYKLPTTPGFCSVIDRPVLAFSQALISAITDCSITIPSARRGATAGRK